MMIISTWWLRTSSKFSEQECEEIYRNIEFLKTRKQARIPNQIKSFIIFAELRPKCVTSLQGPSPRHCARRQHSSFRRHVAAVASSWQHHVLFDRPEDCTLDLPLHRRERYRLTNWPVVRIPSSKK